MAKPAHLFAGLLAVLTLTACGAQTTTAPAADRDTVSVSGEGSVKARPDVFSLVAVARERGDDIAAMKNTVDQQVQAMLDLADELDIEEKNVTASDIQISPEWEYQPERKLIGHQVSREVTFKVAGMDRYARLADGLADQGLKEVRPAGSEISNADALAKQALKKAVKDAREKAGILARAAGRELGEAVVINAQGYTMPQPMMMRAAMAKEDSMESYRPGEQDVSANVQITFELK
ncbi:MAG: SIMPL domain-containing protein [Alcanivorax sp.]|uniref:SIMPL domain-containing protein n=1 Tax=Alloalcanivorax marinus TaxID=1177169 RepID=UPI00195C5A21|nr:SIMPL domain-containing protein [Alloalcanivorax marinus]MBM7334334.1 SIMPL domain-containing protein [Alloalcanivorax marinus]